MTQTKGRSLPSMTGNALIEEALNQYYQTESENLDQWVSLRYGGKLKEHLPRVLLRPLRDLMGRPGKKVRGRLVRLGYEMAFPSRLLVPNQSTFPEKLSEVLELLHSGSLAIDDLQDGSKIRRGQPTLHLKYGLPLALNTGNWLYFWPLEIVRRLHLPPERELQIYRFYHRTLIRAHVGQALDVGLIINRVPKEKVPGVCLSTLELKSGALFALALVMGAIAGGADEELIGLLDEFGHGFGMMLQMYDDLGNIKGRVDPSKRWEDLILRRPTFIWAVAAKRYSTPVYDQFVTAVLQLPQDQRLQRWLDQQEFFETAKEEIHHHLEKCNTKLEAAFIDKPCYKKPLMRLKELGLEISKAYG